MTHAGIRKLKDHLSEYIRRAREGERVVITDRGRPVAALVALPEEAGSEVACTWCARGSRTGAAASRRVLRPRLGSPGAVRRRLSVRIAGDPLYRGRRGLRTWSPHLLQIFIDRMFERENVVDPIHGMLVPIAVNSVAGDHAPCTWRSTSLTSAGSSTRSAGISTTFPPCQMTSGRPSCRCRRITRR